MPAAESTEIRSKGVCGCGGGGDDTLERGQTKPLRAQKVPRLREGRDM